MLRLCDSLCLQPSLGTKGHPYRVVSCPVLFRDTFGTCPF
ncbi:hypothetical protein [Caudoviricetes sp.]|nr:hypothetical protein [Caudoviricetes sp.]